MLLRKIKGPGLWPGLMYGGACFFVFFLQVGLGLLVNQARLCRAMGSTA